ncbi:tetratricopeptide repeat protein 17-like [Anthonomus grandis grandis]|uniref:tetratricopeptide repeat protein 17-like n=1 Tax=Anthonomus grandis grandis TaxID=2921223 RepID=UPI0021654ABD|nr:tetratricopeptide repeat protein 17-like [Anthonomus grandis grandis]
MKYSMEALPKIPLNFIAVFYIIGFETITTDSRSSTLWRLNTDRTKIVEVSPENLKKEPGSEQERVLQQYVRTEDPVFNIITSTERYGNAWVKHKEDSFCNGCSSRVEAVKKIRKNGTRADVNQTDSILDPNEHELACGKPVNFTFYDNLVGVMNREEHPAIVEPGATIEFIRKYKFKTGRSFDLELVENKLRQIKKEKPKSIHTLHQLGNYWRVKGDPRRAIECFRKALFMSPHHAEILLNLAKVLFHLQYLDDAIYLTRRSLEVAPPERGAWQQYFTLGEIFKAYGHYQEAQVHFRHTLDLNPGYEPAIKLLKELEEMPLSPWQSYTYFIIGSLVVMVLVFLNNLDKTVEGGPSRTQKPFNKGLKGISWSGKKIKKVTNT